MGCKYVKAMVETGWRVMVLCNLPPDYNEKELYKQLQRTGCDIRPIEKFYYPFYPRNSSMPYGLYFVSDRLS